MDNRRELRMKKTPQVGFDESSSQASSIQQSNLPLSQRSYVSLACDLCRKRRRKCDGLKPCGPCCNSRDTCVYDATQDKRRQRLKQEDIEDLLLRRDVLDGLLKSVLDDSYVTLVEHIKNGICIEDLASIVKDWPQAGPPITWHPARSDPTSSPATIYNSQEHLYHNTSYSISGLPALGPPDPQSIVPITSKNPMISETGQDFQSYAYTPSTQPLMDSMTSTYGSTTEQTGEITAQQPGSSDRTAWHPSLQLRWRGSGNDAPRRESKRSADGDQILDPTDPSKSSFHPLPLSRQDSINKEKVILGNSEQISRIDPETQLLVDRVTLQWQKRAEQYQHGIHPYASPGYIRRFGNLPFSASVVANHYPTQYQMQQSDNFRRPEWSIIPLMEFDDSALGRIYTDFQQLGQDLIAQGIPTMQLIGLEAVDVELYFRERHAEDPMTADTWASELQRTFGNEFTHTVKLACLYMLARLMRWLLLPSPSTYAQLPPMIRPTYHQRLLPHPSAVDLCPIPSLRDSLITNMRDFVGACARCGMDINWPYSINEALVVDPDTGRLQISQEFVDHISLSENWIVGSSVLHEFPELAGSEVHLSDNAIIRPIDKWL